MDEPKEPQLGDVRKGIYAFAERTRGLNPNAVEVFPVGHDDPEQQRLRRIAAWAASNGLLGPDGEPRKILGTLPVTADGCIVGDGARVYFETESSFNGFIVTEWDVTGVSDDIPVERYFSTRSAAEAAAKGGSDA